MRIVELTKDVQEKIEAGSIGRVEGVIVPGHSIWVNFGWGIGAVAVSEHAVKDASQYWYHLATKAGNGWPYRSATRIDIEAPGSDGAGNKGT